MERTKILGICGSLRADSYNMAILRAARELCPQDAELTIFDQLADIPPFNQDEETRPPSSVVALKRAVREADAILFATPEYNYSVPGVLKNAIDWASRPYGDSAWEGKPAAIMGASVGVLGSARAQYHLRQSFVFLDMHPINRPEVMLGNAAASITNGRLTNDTSRQLIRELLGNLVDWTAQLRSGAERRQLAGMPGR